MPNVLDPIQTRINRLGDILIGFWRVNYANEGGDHWGVTFIYNDTYYDIRPRKELTEALDAAISDVSDLMGGVGLPQAAMAPPHNGVLLSERLKLLTGLHPQVAMVGCYNYRYTDDDRQKSQWAVTIRSWGKYADVWGLAPAAVVMDSAVTVMREHVEAGRDAIMPSAQEATT